MTFCASSPSRSRVALAIRCTLALVVALVVAGCKEQNPPPASYDASRVRRVFRPPPDQVRPVPPHAIHAKGIGPYELGMPLQNILDLLPHGPRVVLTQIDGLLDYNLVRADSETLVIGETRPRGVVFVSVLDERIARTEQGVGVGTSLRDLRAAMGSPIAHSSLVMDPRMVGFQSLPNARFVLAGRDDKRTVAAVTIHGIHPRQAQLLRSADAADERAEADATAAGVPGKDERGVPLSTGSVPPSSAGERSRVGKPRTGDKGNETARVASKAVECAADELASRQKKLFALARLPSRERPGARIRFGCFSSTPAGSPAALIYSYARIVLVAGDPRKPRRLATLDTKGLIHAAPLDVDGDGQYEIAVVSQQVAARGPGRERVSRIQILRLESGRLQVLADRRLYRLSTRSAAWVGASLDDVDLLLELWASPDRVEVHGLYVQWSDQGRPTNAAQLAPVSVPIRRKRVVPTPPNAAAARDGGVATSDGGVRNAIKDAGVSAVDARPAAGRPAPGKAPAKGAAVPAQP